MENNNCVSYLEILISRFNNEIQASMSKGERPNAQKRQLWMECQKRKITIETAC